MEKYDTNPNVHDFCGQIGEGGRSVGPYQIFQKRESLIPSFLLPNQIWPLPFPIIIYACLKDYNLKNQT